VNNILHEIVLNPPVFRGGDENGVICSIGYDLTLSTVINSLGEDSTSYWLDSWEIEIQQGAGADSTDLWTLKLLSTDAPLDTYTFSIHVFSTATSNIDGSQASETFSFDLLLTSCESMNVTLESGWLDIIGENNPTEISTDEKMSFEVTSPVFSRNGDLGDCPTVFDVQNVKDLYGNTMEGFTIEFSETVEGKNTLEITAE
jgi:hypothetical protein